MATELDFDGLDEAVVLALGRVAWSAINLEGRVTVVCEGVLERERGRTPIGTLIASARQALDVPEASAAAKTLVGWLDEARAALDTRNEVMHSVPVVAAPEGGSKLDNLLHFPNDGSATVFTPLDADHLNNIADRAQAIHAKWMYVWIAV